MLHCNLAVPAAALLRVLTNGYNCYPEYGLANRRSKSFVIISRPESQTPAGSKAEPSVRHVFLRFCKMERWSYCITASCAIDNLSWCKYNGALRRGWSIDRDGL